MLNTLSLLALLAIIITGQVEDWCAVEMTTFQLAIRDEPVI